MHARRTRKVHRRQADVTQMETARLRCTQRLAKKTMYPNLDMATTVAAAVLRDELPGVDVPPSVVTKLAGKVRRSPRLLLSTSPKCLSKSARRWPTHDGAAMHTLPGNVTDDAATI